MTPQDIREKTFEKAVFGGYDMAAVDECLEEIYEDYSTLQKENATLKAKLKVLASKIEEYRESEDAMRMALLSAQKMGVQIESEAKTKSERMVAEAEAKSAKLTRDAQLEVANEEARLVEAKRTSAQFLDNMRLLCQKQLDFLDHLGEMKIVDNVPPARAGADADTIKIIQNNVARAAEAPAAEMDISRELDKIPTPASADQTDTKTFPPINAKNFNFDNLKYGEKK